MKHSRSWKMLCQGKVSTLEVAGGELRVRDVRAYQDSLKSLFVEAMSRSPQRRAQMASRVPRKQLSD